jgi:hypothetical protein
MLAVPVAGSASPLSSAASVGAFDFRRDRCQRSFNGLGPEFPGGGFKLGREFA